MNYPGDFRSADKVKGFLAVHKMKMSQLEIYETKSTSDELDPNSNLNDNIFNSIVRDTMSDILLKQ